MDKVEICYDHTGKMEGIASISTAVTLNRNCQENQKVIGSICRHCYAENMAAMYKALDEKNRRNTEVLTSRVLEDDELPVIDVSKYPYFRFESFGDLNNMTQLINYVNIVKKNPEVRFALWSKMYKLVYDYFKDNKCPDNMNVLLSSLFINKPLDISMFEATGNFEKGQLKVFTVYDYYYIKDHPELVINCGSKECFKCHQCYSKTPAVYINEILKSDQGKAEELITLRDPVKRRKLLDSLKFDDAD